jgi:hypothetical protein
VLLRLRPSFEAQAVKRKSVNMAKIMCVFMVNLLVVPAFIDAISMPIKYTLKRPL